VEPRFDRVILSWLQFAATTIFHITWLLWSIGLAAKSAKPAMTSKKVTKQGKSGGPWFSFPTIVPAPA
jgi:cytochrome bd-type quinol oxidase subunit 1